MYTCKLNNAAVFLPRKEITDEKSTWAVKNRLNVYWSETIKWVFFCIKNDILPGGILKHIHVGNFRCFPPFIELDIMKGLDVFYDYILNLKSDNFEISLLITLDVILEKSRSRLNILNSIIIILNILNFISFSF